MSFTISGDEAYQTYLNSDIKKPGIKSASFETIEAILKKKGVKIRTKPSDSVRFLLLSFLPASAYAAPCTRSFAHACSGRQLRCMQRLCILRVWRSFVSTILN